VRPTISILSDPRPKLWSLEIARFSPNVRTKIKGDLVVYAIPFSTCTESRALTTDPQGKAIEDPAGIE
jgi:hypothetical protein